MDLKIFEELSRIWEKVFKLRNGFSLWAYVPTLVLVVGAWYLLKCPIPFISLLLISLLLHPPVFCGGVLCLFILAYGMTSERLIQSLKFTILRTKFEQVLGLKPSSCREQDLFF